MFGIMLYTMLNDYRITKENERKIYELKQKCELEKGQAIKRKGTSPKEK